jgi:hypothetical protein
MKYQKLLFLFFISSNLGFKNPEFLRKLNQEGDTEKFPEEINTSEAIPNIPNHKPDSIIPESTEPEITSSNNGTDSDTTIQNNGTETDIAIPSVISTQTYPTNIEKSILVLIGVGNYIIPPVHTPGRKIAFVVYYKVIIGTYILLISMTVIVKVTYYYRILI